MLSRFIAVAVALFAAQAAQANPLVSNGPVSFAGSLPVKNIDSAAVHPNVALPRPFISKTLHRDARQEDPLNLLTCALPNCASCTEFGLSVVIPNDCVPVPPFSSVGILDTSGEELPFEVFVGTAGCTEVAQIPAVNECFNLPPNSGLTFESFGVVEN